jgi:hypothetical protein
MHLYIPPVLCMHSNTCSVEAALHTRRLLPNTLPLCFLLPLLLLIPLPVPLVPGLLLC